MSAMMGEHGLTGTLIEGSNTLKHRNLDAGAVQFLRWLKILCLGAGIRDLPYLPYIEGMRLRREVRAE